MRYVKITFDNLPEDAINHNNSCHLKPSQLQGANVGIHCNRVIIYGSESACCAMQQCKNILMAE
jgi:hypothetical protein